MIDFDDIYVPPPPRSGRNAVLLAKGYGGFIWSGGQGSNSWIIAQNGDGYWRDIPAPSGQNLVWSNGGTDLSMSEMSGEQFTLDSFLGRAFSSRPVTLRGFLDGQEIMTRTVNITNRFQQFDLNMKGVDKVTWSTNGKFNLLLDDITVSAVPEPQTYAMMLAGLGLLGFMARRRRQA